MGPAILHRGNDDRATACRHYRRARRPVRVAIKDPGNRLKFPDDRSGVLVELDHAETVVGRRLSGLAGLRISSSDVKTFTSAGDGAPHTATASGVSAGTSAAIRKSAIYRARIKTHRDNPPLLNRTIAL